MVLNVSSIQLAIVTILVHTVVKVVGTTWSRFLQIQAIVHNARQSQTAFSAIKIVLHRVQSVEMVSLPKVMEHALNATVTAQNASAI